MRYVDTNAEVLQFPEESLSGDAGVGVGLLDTGWDLNWPGPGHVYLSDRDIVDILVAAKDAELVVDALKKNGWTAPDEVAAEVFELNQKLGVALDELDQATAVQAGYAAALKELEAAKPKAAAKTKTHATKE